MSIFNLEITLRKEASYHCSVTTVSKLSIFLLPVIESNERIEYSYISLADFLFFFSGKKSLNLFTLSLDFWRFDLRFLKFSAFLLFTLAKLVL